jgi:hypothetical protein
MKYKRKFINENMGKTFYDKVVVPKIKERLMKEQKDTLAEVQPLVEWEKQIKEQKRKVRFGIRGVIPQRPKMTKLEQHDEFFPCPKNECKGFVKNGVCGICKSKICEKCREEMKEKHRCNVEALQTIEMLKKDSKPCPSCCALIQRTHGCADMFCPNCQTHFNWNTLKIDNVNTNMHYMDLHFFSKDVAKLKVDNKGRPIEQHECGLSKYDKIRKRMLNEKVNKEVIKCIWDDSNEIRLMRSEHYDKDVINNISQEALQELQLKYLMNEIDEIKWTKQVYRICTKRTMDLLYSDILTMYISVIDTYQQLIHNDYKQQNKIFAEYEKLVSLCNESFESVSDEYGGAIHHIKHPTEIDEIPSFV